MRHLLAGIDAAASAPALKRSIMDEVAAPFGAGATGLYFFGADGGVAEMHTRGVRDGFTLAYEQLGRGADPILERAICARNVTHDAMVFRGDDWTRSALYRQCGGPWKIKHYLCAPIVVGDQVVGTLNLGRRSAAHPFGPTDTARVARVCRRIATRLAAFAPAPDALGRLRADRTQIRLHAASLEDGSPPLSPADASGLWDAVAAGRLTPLDTFDQGDRTYLLLPVADAPPAVSLTPRESQVVIRFAAGLAPKAIAYELGLSPSTVSSVLSTIRHKLGARSRVQVVELARRLGLAL